MVSTHLEELLLGTRVMKRMAGAEEALIAIKVSHPKLIEQVRQACADVEGVNVAPVPDVYPMGWERVLVRELLHREYEKLPAEAGAIVNNATTAIAFANDPVSACKACVQFAKDNEKLIVVGGAMGTGVLSVAEINKLATIPSMDELRAKIIGLLQAPGAQLARVTKAYSEKEAA